MNMSGKFVRRVANCCSVIAVAAAFFMVSSAAGAADAASGKSDANDARGRCFNLREWQGGWKTTPDARTIYINVSHRIYRLDLEAAYPLLQSAFSVLRYRDSSNIICDAVDFRLVVSDRIGTTEDVIVRHVTVLTAAEAAALPKTLRPLA
jgi:hypothetical protein